LHPYLQRTRDAIDAATAGMPPEQLPRRPAEGKWSVAEILEHLARAFNETLPGLKKCCERDRTIAKSATVYQRLATMLVVGLGYFPSGRPAPTMTVPRGMQAEESMNVIRYSLSTMDELLGRCEQRFGKAKLMNHPVLGPLAAWEWRKFHWVHTRHHMKQIAALRQRG
jgi:DinB superfamily